MTYEHGIDLGEHVDEDDPVGVGFSSAAVSDGLVNSQNSLEELRLTVFEEPNDPVMLHMKVTEPIRSLIGFRNLR